MFEPDSSEVALDELLTQARSGLSPDAATAQRVRSALLDEVPSPAQSSSSGLTSGAWPLASTLKRVAPALWLGLGLGAGYQLASLPAPQPPELPTRPGTVQDLAQPPLLPTVTEATKAKAQPAPPRQPSKSRMERPRASKSHGATAKPSPSLPAAHSLQSELLLLQRVERAIRANNGQWALVLLQELDPKQTTLREEGLAMTVLARCQLSQNAAPQAATEFLHAHPSSVYRKRITTTCALNSLHSLHPARDESSKSGH